MAEADNLMSSPQGIGNALALLAPLLFITSAQAEIGLDVSPNFTVDTRYEFNTGSSVSGLFRVDTRFSGSSGSGESGLFTVDTQGAITPVATLFGVITEPGSGALAGAVVRALQGGVARASAISDGAGNYELPILPAGFYTITAAKPGWRTARLERVRLQAGTSALDFALRPAPPTPNVETVTRSEPVIELVTVSSEQLKVFDGVNFITGGQVNPTKPTVVLAHGWNSNPRAWASDMAARIYLQGIDANLLAWDWESQANTGFELGVALSRTCGQGEGLGMALEAVLPAGYSRPIHFVGHSFGTVVNAMAANYLHDPNKAGLDPNRTQMTLLDDAELANIGGRIITLGRAAIDVKTANYGSLLVDSATLLSCGWASPIPECYSRIDNYISFVGLLHGQAVNTLLVKAGTEADTSSILSFVSDIPKIHSFAPKWYSCSVTDFTEPLIGHREGYERLAAGAAFPPSWPYPAGVWLAQDFASNSKLGLKPLLTEAEQEEALSYFPVFRAAQELEKAVDAVLGTIKKVGDVVVKTVETVAVATYRGVNAAGRAVRDTAVVTGQAVKESFVFAHDTAVWAVQATFRKTRTPLPGGQLARVAVGKGLDAAGIGQMEANVPAFIWLTVVIPSNAVTMAFDFTFGPGGSNECFVAGINGTNIFALEAKHAVEGERLNSGLLEVARYAGQTVELYFGYTGGESTDATATLEGIFFYRAAAPELHARRQGQGVVVTWPFLTPDFVLETATQLGVADGWSLVTDRVTVTNFQNMVTNRMDGPGRFYRLRRN